MAAPNTILYIDCFSGAAGDMFLGALLDLGLPEEDLRAGLGKLALDFDLKIEKSQASGIQATRIQVKTATDQPHRNLAQIQSIIKASGLPDNVTSLALDIFTILAKAEAAVHGCPLAEVHFHEVGAIDAIVDIVGTAIGLNHFGIRRCICAPLPMPHGLAKCRHGILPLPAPAVTEIVQGLPVYGVDLDQEMLTPTGAAIIKGIATGFGPLPSMRISATGHGAGSRTFSDQRPNLLRLFLGQAEERDEAQEVEIIETNLDDLSPEIIPYLIEKLFEAKALDVVTVPILMKKGRPGVQLQVICRPVDAPAVKECMLTETSAIGLRFRREARLTLPRRQGKVSSQWGEVGAKLVKTPKGEIITPEYEDCRRIARQQNVPLLTVYREIAARLPAEFIED